MDAEEHETSTAAGPGSRETPISLARPLRSSAPIYRKLHDAATEPCVIAFQTTALFNDDGQQALTLPELMTRWKVGRPAATRARKALIELGYWAYVRPRDASGQLGHEIRVWESPATGADLAELAQEYRPGSRIECGGATYHVADDGALIPAGRTRRQKTDTWSPSTRKQKTDTWLEQGKHTRQQKTAIWSPDGSQDADSGVSAGRTRRQKTDTYRKKEREILQGSLSTDRGGSTPGLDGPDAAPQAGDDAALPCREDVAAVLRTVGWVSGGVTPSPNEFNELVDLACTAMSRYGATLDQVRWYAARKVRQSKTNPPAYVLKAFRERAAEVAREQDPHARIEFEDDPELVSAVARKNTTSAETSESQRMSVEAADEQVRGWYEKGRTGANAAARVLGVSWPRPERDDFDGSPEGSYAYFAACDERAREWIQTNYHELINALTSQRVA